MNRILKKTAWGVSVLVMIGLAILLVQHRKSELASMPPPEPRPIVVHVETVESGELALAEHYLGTVEAISVATVSSRVTGHLRTVTKDVGDPVTAAEILGRIDDRTLSKQEQALLAELDGAREDLGEKKDQFERRKALFRKNLIAEELRDTAERAYLMAKAKVRRLEAEAESAAVSLEYAVLEAPFDGVVTERAKDVGDLAMPGQPVYTVEQPSAGYKILVKVPQKTAGRIQPGAKAVLTSGGQNVQATVDRIHPAMNRRSLATVELRRQGRPFGLPTGATVGVDLITGQASGIRVPERAILEYEESAYVFRVKEKNRVEKIKVAVIGRNRGHAVIEGTVSAGDRLVVGNESMLIQLGDNSRIHSVKGER